MADSSLKLARLKRRIETLSRLPGSSTGGGESARLFTLGHAPLDDRLGGGLACGAVHEVLSPEPVSASALALLLALRAVPLGQPILWIVTDKAERDHGTIYAPGLIELGADPDIFIMIHAPDELAALRAAAESIGCGGVGAVVLDAGAAKKLDLTASRRLALAGEKSGVTSFILRGTETSFASAASTRWHVAAAPSAALHGNAPGQAALMLSLLRHRGGVAPFDMILEWDRDSCSFCEPALSRLVLPLPARRALDDGEERAAA